MLQQVLLSMYVILNVDIAWQNYELAYDISIFSLYTIAFNRWLYLLNLTKITHFPPNFVVFAFLFLDKDSSYIIK